MSASSVMAEKDEEAPAERHCLTRQGAGFEPQPDDDCARRCVQCRRPFDVIPWQDYCAHRFCDQCFCDLCASNSYCPACMTENDFYKVGSKLHFRDKSYLRMRDLKAKCGFDPPCGWEGDFNQVSEHEIRCENRKVACCNCSARVLWRQLKDHVTTECRHRRVICHHCQFETTYSAIIEHERAGCPFYQNALLQHASKRRDNVKGIWMLQKVMHQRLDAQRHLPSTANSKLSTNGNTGVGEKRPNLQPDDEFQRTRSRLEDFKNSLEDLIRATDSKDPISLPSVSQLRKEIERICKEFVQLESSKDLENTQSVGCVAIIEGGENLQTSDAIELENLQSKESTTTAGSIGKEVPKEGKRTESEFGFMEQVNSNSTAAEEIDPENSFNMKRERIDDVHVVDAETRISQESKEAEKKLAAERNDMENNESNEDGDVASERRAPPSIKEEVTHHRLYGKVDLTEEMETKYKGIGVDDEMLEFDQGRETETATEERNEDDSTSEAHRIIDKNFLECRPNSCCCQNDGQKESCSKQSHLFYDPVGVTAASNESMEPASNEKKRKKKNKKKMSLDQDHGTFNNKTIESKVERVNVLYPSEICSSKTNVCEEKVVILERAMEVLMSEMERMTQRNDLLLKLVRDQHDLERRLSVIEARQSIP